MKRFKVGDHVMISPSSIYWGEGDSNPSYTKGEVIEDDLTVDNHIYKVEWDNGEYNVYRERDLIPYDEIELLLEKARRRFKPGCRYLTTDGVEYKSSKSDFLYVYSKYPIRIAMTNSKGFIYDGTNGKWGEVIEEPKACKFKVGDRVIGNKGASCYSTTKEGWVGYVVEVGSETSMEVKGPGILSSVTVNSEYFDLLPEEEEPAIPPKHPYDNCVIEVLDVEHGNKVIRWWQSQGVNTGCLTGNCTKEEGYDVRFYGLSGGCFDNFDMDYCIECNLEIIELPSENSTTKGNIHSQIKTKQNGSTKQQAESGKTIKVQRVDLQIRKGSIGRRAGLKGSGVEVSIGNRHRNHKTRSIIG